MKIFSKEEGRLPYGYYTKSDFKKAQIASLIAGVLIATIFLLIYHFSNNLLISVAIFVILFLIYFFICGTKFNQLNKVLKEYISDLDFKKLEDKLQMFMKENLHSASRNELLMQFSNILLNHDKERAYKMFENVKEPSLNKWIFEYYQVNMLLNKKDFDNAKMLFETFKIKYSNKVSKYYYNTMELNILINCESDEIVDFENRNMYFKNNRFDKIMAYTRAMKYYHSRNKVESAKKYANLIKNENAKFTEIDKLVEEVLYENS